jgi:hypothetical protein
MCNSPLNVVSETLQLDGPALLACHSWHGVWTRHAKIRITDSRPRSGMASRDANS